MRCSRKSVLGVHVKKNQTPCGSVGNRKCSSISIVRAKDAVLYDKVLIHIVCDRSLNSLDFDVASVFTVSRTPAIRFVVF
jgi:hypothetical protein